MSSYSTIIISATKNWHLENNTAFSETIADDFYIDKKYKVQKHAFDVALSSDVPLWVSTFSRVMSVGLNTHRQPPPQVSPTLH